MNKLQQINVLSMQCEQFEKILEKKGFQYLRTPTEDGFIYSYLCEDFENIEILYGLQDLIKSQMNKN